MRTIKIASLLALLMSFPPAAFAGAAPFLPFAGWYESSGSHAREKTNDGRWREIPQDIKMQFVRDDNIIELQLFIDVYDEKSRTRTFMYTIENKMWLVKKQNSTVRRSLEKAEFDVFKHSKQTNRFEDRGDGYCSAIECRYSYVTEESGGQQRYQSHISWQRNNAGIGFNQTGSLSRKPEGEVEWVTFKTWDNNFTSRAPAP